MVPGQSAPVPSPSAVETVASSEPGVHAYLVAFVAAWNAHDVEGILRLSSDDCVAVNRFGAILIGKQENRKQQERLQTQVFKDAHFPPLRLLHERTLAPGLVIIQAAWQNPSLEPPPAPQVNDMVVTFVLRKSGDHWVAEQIDLHNVETPPNLRKP
jgi:uncharacterized protein (TIGR02246 family)